jgi:hypothetical protein
MSGIINKSNSKGQLISKRGFAVLRNDRLLLGILLIGVFIRVFFVLIGAKAYYGPVQMFMNGDSDSYIMSFQNLLKHGAYTFDFLEPEASFGRLPGYPFFYGIHYLLFGQEYAIKAVAWTQAIMDCFSIFLIFLIACKVAAKDNYFAPYAAAAIYAFYPFIIIWTTIIGTELLATFLTLVWLYTLLSDSRSWTHFALLGLEVALLFYVREFLGIMLPITCLYLLFSKRENWQRAIRNCVFVGIGFGALYIWWPTRNYAFQHRLVLVKPERAGFANYKVDMTSFLDWVHSWSNESTYWLQQTLNNPHPNFPNEIFASSQEQKQAQKLVARANDCGSSFYLYKNVGKIHYDDVQAMRQNRDYTVECNAEIQQGFEQLRLSYKRRNPVAYYTKVPLENLFKVFFKSGTQASDGKSRKQLLLVAVFGYRSLLLILGIVGLVIYRKLEGIQPIFVFWVFIVIFLCWYFRQLEMRYLLQADVLLIVPASLLIGRWLSQYWGLTKLRESVDVE